MTDKKKLKIAIEVLKSIAASHLPRANTKTFWYHKTIADCAEILAEDTDMARQALIDMGEK